ARHRVVESEHADKRIVRELGVAEDISEVHMGRERAESRGGDREPAPREGARAEEVLLVTGREATVEEDRGAERVALRQVDLQASRDVADSGRGAVHIR